jgi:hypothetical protein
LEPERSREEYEIDRGAVEALTLIEREAAIECGQRSENADITINGKLDHRAAVLADAFSSEELEAMQQKVIAAAEEKQQPIPPQEAWGAIPTPTRKPN